MRRDSTAFLPEDQTSGYCLLNEADACAKVPTLPLIVEIGPLKRNVTKVACVTSRIALGKYGEDFITSKLEQCDRYVGTSNQPSARVDRALATDKSFLNDLQSSIPIRGDYLHSLNPSSKISSPLKTSTGNRPPDPFDLSSRSASASFQPSLRQTSASRRAIPPGVLRWLTDAIRSLVCVKHRI